MDYTILNREDRNGVAFVTVSRPKAMNALNSTFFKEMDQMILDIRDDSSIRVMVITGDGKAFVAGADIAEMVDMTQEQGAAFSKIGQNTFRNLELLEKPVIAAVNGFALGGGCELAMACDFRIASAKAKFGQPEVTLGLTPGYAGTQRLARLTGLGNALMLLMTGDMIRADEALRIGLVQKVVEPEELMTVVETIAGNIAAKGPGAVRLVKKLVRRGLLTDFDTGCEMESRDFGSLFQGEGEEGMRAFLEKRPPKWD